MVWTYALWVCFALIALVLAGFVWTFWDASREPRRLRKIIRRVTGVVATAPVVAQPAAQPPTVAWPTRWDIVRIAFVLSLLTHWLLAGYASPVARAGFVFAMGLPSQEPQRRNWWLLVVYALAAAGAMAVPDPLGATAALAAGGGAILALHWRERPSYEGSVDYVMAEGWDFYDRYRQGDLPGASDSLMKRFAHSTSAREVARDLTLLGRIRKEQGRAAEAEEIWQAAEEADPAFGGVPMDRALTLAHESRFAEALPLAEVALEREPLWPTGAAILAWIQAGAGAMDESRRWSEKAKTEKLTDVEAGPHRYYLAMAAHLRGERDEARAALVQVVDRDPESSYGRCARQILDAPGA